jgi:hypothetical protein
LVTAELEMALSAIEKLGAEKVAVMVGVTLAVAVGVEVKVMVGVEVGVGVAVLVKVGVMVGVGVTVWVGTGVMVPAKLFPKKKLMLAVEAEAVTGLAGGLGLVVL